MNGFALRLVLKQRHKRTRKWPVVRVLPELGDDPRKIALSGTSTSKTARLPSMRT